MSNPSAIAEKLERLKKTRGASVKTMTIRLADVEAAMLVEEQKRNNAFKGLPQLLIQHIRQEYARTPLGKALKQ